MIKRAMMVVGLVVVSAVSAQFGYYAGQERPRVFRSDTAFDERTYFGWDKGNGCVASWGYTANGFSYWTRLE